MLIIQFTSAMWNIATYDEKKCNVYQVAKKKKSANSEQQNKRKSVYIVSIRYMSNASMKTEQKYSEFN